MLKTDIDKMTNVNLSLYTEYLIQNPVVACSRRQLNHFCDAQRLMAHANIWKEIIDNTDPTTFCIVTETDRYPTQSVALQWLLSDEVDLVVLAYTSSFRWSNPLRTHQITEFFTAETGTFAYALTRNAALRLYNNALPIEEPIDTLLITLSEIDVLRVALAPDAFVSYAPIMSLAYWKNISKTNTKQFLPDWTCYTIFLVIVVSLIFAVLLRRWMCALNM